MARAAINGPCTPSRPKAAAGIAQAVYDQRYQLIEDPRFQQQVVNLCRILPCAESEFTSPEQIRLLERNVPVLIVGRNAERLAAVQAVKSAVTHNDNAVSGCCHSQCPLYQGIRVLKGFLFIGGDNTTQIPLQIRRR